MYHGFLPMLVRECVTAITCAGPDGSSSTFPLYFATSLFSFLYHLATYENSESLCWIVLHLLYLGVGHFLGDRWRCTGE